MTKNDPPRSFPPEKGHKTHKTRLQRPIFGSSLASWAGKWLVVNLYARRAWRLTQGIFCPAGKAWPNYKATVALFFEVLAFLLVLGSLATLS